MLLPLSVVGLVAVGLAADRVLALAAAAAAAVALAQHSGLVAVGPAAADRAVDLAAAPADSAAHHLHPADLPGHVRPWLGRHLGQHSTSKALPVRICRNS